MHRCGRCGDCEGFSLDPCVYTLEFVILVHSDRMETAESLQPKQRWQCSHIKTQGLSGKQLLPDIVSKII